MAKKIQGTSTLVTVLSTKGASTLVEYLKDGVVHRKYVPMAKVSNQFVADEVLERGIPYGFPWDEIVISFDMQQFAVEMHNADLWTAEDVLKSPKKVTGVLRKIFEQSFRTVLETAVQEKKRR
jgi:hypothetical protein